MATPIKWGNEFPVNAITTGHQSEPSVAALADGRFVAIWTDTSGTLGDSDVAVHGQFFAADGSRIGNEFRVNTSAASSQYNSHITALSDGRFVANWQEGSSGTANVIATIFNPDGTKFGAGDFTVHEDAIPGSLATLAHDLFVATWFSLVDGNIHAQLYQPDGAKFGADITVNTQMNGLRFDPSAAALPNDRFVVTWTITAGVTEQILGQLFTNDGSMLGDEFLVVSQPGLEQASDVTVLADGRFVVSWEHATGNGTVVHAQVFNADATRSGAEILVGTLVYSPTIAALNDGRFVVAWADLVDLDVHAQVFNIDGTRSGAEFILNTHVAGDQFDPSIAVLADGRLITAWANSSADGSGLGLNAQIFDPRESGVSLAGTALNDAFIGTDFDDVFMGTDGADRLIGMGGDDLFEGGAGPDILLGGDGNDTASYRNSPDFVFVLLQIEQGSAGDALFDFLQSIENLVGSGHGDILVGSDGDNVIEGGPGDDDIDGLGGDDTLSGGVGSDTAEYTSDFNDNTVMDFGANLVVAGPEGTDTLGSIEHLKFTDVTITPADFDDGNPLFDTLYYLSRNPDVFHAGVNALDHFNTFGWHEGRDPNAFFDTSEYLQVYQDAAASGMNPLEHYHQTGWQQGHDPAANFDTRSYLAHNPDVAAAGIDPLRHFLQFGFAEGRQAYAAIGDKIVGGFDAEFYLRHNADVAAAGVDPLAHFNIFGWHEGRNPNAWFDTAGYLAHYADVAAADVNPLEHYEQFGWQEGRDPSAGFDTAGYLAANPDVAAAHVNPLDHFLTFGIFEGRHAVNDGVWH